MNFLRLGVAILLVTVTYATSAQAAQSRKKLTDFIPALDMIQQPNNFKGRGSSTHGECAGVSELALVNYERNQSRRSYGSLPAGTVLSHIEKQMKSTRLSQGKTATSQYVKDIMNLAQNHTVARGNLQAWSDGSKDMPRGMTVSQHLIDDMKQTRLPQRVQWREGSVPHLVLAYDVTESSETTTFHVADPNYPKDGNRVLVFDKRDGSWQRSYTDPRTGRTTLKRTYPALKSDPNLPDHLRRFPTAAERKFYLDLLDYAHQGINISAIGKKLGVSVTEVPVPNTKTRPSPGSVRKKSTSRRSTSTKISSGDRKARLRQLYFEMKALHSQQSAVIRSRSRSRVNAYNAKADRLIREARALGVNLPAPAQIGIPVDR